jgi:TP53 regulating kinase-like protein
MKSEKETVLQRGAEAVIVKQGVNVIKRRAKKKYRLEIIDEKIRKLRTRNEGKMLERASKVTSIPKIKNVDEKKGEILLEFIDGKKLSEHLSSFKLVKQKDILKTIGEEISKMHNAYLIHGDLTTSNMILEEKSGKIFFVDFGLGFHSSKIEDRAVDLHLLRQALEAKHFENWHQLFKSVVEGYSKKNPLSEEIIKRLKRVEARGRYKGGY